MINWLVFSTFVFSFAMPLFGVLVDLTYEVQYAPKIAKLQKTHEQQLPDYLQSHRDYANHPVFRPRIPAKKDLSLLIGQLQKGDLQRSLIDEELKKEIYSMGSDWLDQKHKIPQLDTVEQLFANIEDYDHWFLGADPENDLASDLIVATQVFLAWTYHNQPVGIRSALTKARRLSEILLNTQNLNYKRAGLSILEKEKTFMDFLKIHVRKATLLWTPVDRLVLRAYRNHLQTTASFLSPLATPTTLQSVFLGGELPIGFCAIYKEKHKLLLWAETYLRPHFFMEPRFEETFAKLHEVRKLAFRQCRNLSELALGDSSMVPWIPFFRRIYATQRILYAEQNRRVL